MSIVRVNQLKYKYPDSDTLAIDDLSFTIEKGEFIGITGMNTAGKSTLCYALCGLVPHFFKGGYGGTVTIDGMDVLTHELSEITSKVGLVFENPFSQMTGAKFTVYDEIAFGLENMGLPREEIHKRISDTMKMLGIEKLKDENPFSLSGGQMQRVAIASVIAMKPAILVLDEPTSQLDPEGTEEVFRIVDMLSKRGMTVIMIEQKLERLAEYANRIILMHEGKIIHDGLPAEVFSRENLFEYSIQPPLYVKIAKALNIHDAQTGLYPVKLQDMHVDRKLSFSLQAARSINYKTVKIDVHNLHFSYNEGIDIIKGMNVTLEGEPIAIIGQNGAGKSTFVKLLKKLLNPNAGEILLDGHTISKRTAAKLAGRIGLVSQNPNDQIFKNNVLDEVLFGPLTIGQSKEVATTNALAMLELVGLSEKTDENPYDLSLAERKMVAIASILAMDTDVVIFDEPTMGQDYLGKLKMKEIINSLYEQGKLVICILHDMDFVAEVFDRTIIFSNGNILFDGPTRVAFSNKAILHQARVEQPHLTKFVGKLGYEEIILDVNELK